MKTPHVIARHGVSFVTGESVVFYEQIEPQWDRGSIIRTVLGWRRGQLETAYPLQSEVARESTKMPAREHRPLGS